MRAIALKRFNEHMKRVMRACQYDLGRDASGAMRFERKTIAIVVYR
ncbi:hypothetical protein DyAD56_23525 [Dyella sp. AD56]|nr:hypothetical protein DyAD56_23525 [Dyella sp. AD56]